MSRASKRVPTLTEVIEVALDKNSLDVPATEAMPLEDLPAAALLELLQPRLEAWVEAHVRQAIADAVPGWTEQIARHVIQDLRADLPEILARAQAAIGSRKS